ncbi:inactive serine/threonine-protein kinase TEX14 [Pelobates fuscus]|uniref:inactive serine/threonine-protein kinase TEX14 n=1 Tax=Pelobates fuscus TaxID=191477 RepID=UPI002FE489CD
MLKRGIFVDSVNSLGQAPLFVASILGIEKVVELLLKFGSDPNLRCFDQSTPVHAAAFSCNPWILSKLIDAGGDLRLHDLEGRKAYSWALMAGKDQNTQMLEFIDRCSIHTQALVQCFPYKPFTNLSTSQVLIHSPSLINLISQRSLSKFLKYEVSFPRNTISLGYGKLCVIGDRKLACMAYIPFIEDKNIVQGDDILTFSFSAGPYMTMTNLMWDSTKVTVKELNFTPTNCSKCHLADLLITEQGYMSKLHHPSLLQLIAVSVSPDLGRTRLVFERVAFGTLYSILHQRRSEFPILHMETILHFLLQVIDGMIFLHLRGFIHRSFSSHAIQIVAAGMAKISNFEYMIESKGERSGSGHVNFPIPSQLFRWAAPEIILERNATVKCDVYSICAVMQELLTDTLPWNGLDGMAIKEAVVSHHYLVADLRLTRPYNEIVSTGIQAKSKDRVMNLQDIRCLLKNDFKNITESKNCATVSLNPPHPDVYPDPNICLQPTKMMTRKLCDHQKKQANVNDDQDQKINEIEKANIHQNCEPSDIDSSDTESLVRMNVEKGSQELLFRSNSESNTVSHSESQTEDLTDQEKKSHSQTETLEPQISHSGNCSLSGTSISETDIESSVVDEDSISEISEPNSDWITEIQMLEGKLCSIRKHINSTIVHLTALSEDNKTCKNEGEDKKLNKCKGAETKRLKESSSERICQNSSDEVDNVVSFLKSKSYAGWTAVGPPEQYMPPESDLWHRPDNIKAKLDMRKLGSKSVMRPQEIETRKEDIWTSCGLKQTNKKEGKPKTQVLKQPSKTNPNFSFKTNDKDSKRCDRSCAKGICGHHEHHEGEISPVWASEVKNMARKTVSGDLRFFQDYLQDEYSSDSDSEDLDQHLQLAYEKHYKHKQQTEIIVKDRFQLDTDNDSEDDDSSVEESKERKLEKIFQNFSERSSWLSECNNSVNQTEACGNSSAIAGKSCKVQCTQPETSHNSSIITFVTAEMDQFEDSEGQSREEEDVDVTQEVCTRKLVPLACSVKKETVGPGANFTERVDSLSQKENSENSAIGEPHQPLNVSEELPQVTEDMCTETSEFSMPGKDHLFYSAKERAFEKGLTEVSRFGVLDNARKKPRQQARSLEQNASSSEKCEKESSVIDIQELSSILCDHKSPSKNHNTPGSKTVSFRISTPVSPDNQTRSMVLISQLEDSGQTDEHLPLLEMATEGREDQGYKLNDSVNDTSEEVNDTSDETDRFYTPLL